MKKLDKVMLILAIIGVLGVVASITGLFFVSQLVAIIFTVVFVALLITAIAVWVAKDKKQKTITKQESCSSDNNSAEDDFTFSLLEKILLYIVLTISVGSTFITQMQLQQGFGWDTIILIGCLALIGFAAVAYLKISNELLSELKNFVRYILIIIFHVGGGIACVFLGQLLPEKIEWTIPVNILLFILGSILGFLALQLLELFFMIMSLLIETIKDFVFKE